MLASWTKLLAAITGLLAALFSAIDRSGRQKADRQRSEEARKAAGYERLLAALKARRKAANRWKKQRDRSEPDRAGSASHSSDN